MRGARRRLRLTSMGVGLLAVLPALVLSVAGCTSSVAATARTEVEGGGLLDSSLIHEIAVFYEQEEYESMISAYKESGEKEWIEAAVTIDGQTYENVGLRLKGNSSLMNLRRPAGFGNAGAGAATTTTAEGVRGGWGDRQGIGAPGGDVSPDDPAGLPWLIDLDRNVDGQNHQGVVELCVRSNTTETALNEAVALELLEAAGLASEQAVAVRFSVNAGEPRLRLMIENPDDVWMAKEFEATGALYKAESTGDYTYRGEDPDSYDEVFDQEAGRTNADLTPLIEFLDFLNNSEDVVFNAQLPARLDVEAFATYLAFEDLIANADDIDGMGNNSYLYYDPTTEKFTVVAWDHNLAFGGMGGAMGGGDRPARQGAQALPDGGTTGGMRPPDGVVLDGGAPDAATPDAATPDAATPDVATPDAATPDVATPDAATPAAGAQVREGDRFGRTKSNILVERFKANSQWQQLYEQKSAQLKSELFESGKAAEILNTWVALLKAQASDLVDQTTVDEEAAAVARHFSS